MNVLKVWEKQNKKKDLSNNQNRYVKPEDDTGMQIILEMQEWTRGWWLLDVSG